MLVPQQEVMKMSIRRDTFTYQSHHKHDQLIAGFMAASVSVPGTYLGFAKGGGGGLRGPRVTPLQNQKTLQIWATIFWEGPHFTKEKNRKNYKK